MEDAVRTHILDLTTAEAKLENVAHSQAAIDDAVDEALAWARQ